MSKAMRAAQNIGSQGYVGRILLSKLDVAERNAADRPAQLESEGELQLKIKAVAENLKSQLSPEEASRSLQTVFEYSIPWQGR